MVCGSPGSARAISGRGTDLNLGPISMSSARANHGGRHSIGKWAKPIAEGPKWACGRGGSSAGWCCRCQNVWVVMRMEEPFLMVLASN